MLITPTCEVKRLHGKKETNLGYSRAYLTTPPTPHLPKKESQKLIASPAPTKGNKSQAANEESYTEEKGAALPALRQAQPVSHVCKPLALVTVISNPHEVLPNGNTRNQTAIYKKGLFYSYMCLQFYIYLDICTVSLNQPLIQGGKQ
jgi:hypothetical protein